MQYSYSAVFSRFLTFRLLFAQLLRLGDSGKATGGPVPSLKLKPLQPPQQQQEQQQRPQQKSSSEKETREVVTLEAERSSHQAVEQTFTTISTKRIMVRSFATFYGIILQ